VSYCSPSQIFIQIHLVEVGKTSCIFPLNLRCSKVAFGILLWEIKQKLLISDFDIGVIISKKKTQVADKVFLNSFAPVNHFAHSNFDLLGVCSSKRDQTWYFRFTMLTYKRKSNSQ